MNHEGRIEMNQDERDRLHWLKQVKDKKVTQKKAAERMEVSPRWVRKLVKRMKRKGDAVVVHGLRGRKSNRKLAEKTQREAIALVQRECADFGPTLASEYLGEKHGISVSKETLRKWMIAGGSGKRAGPSWWKCMVGVHAAAVGANWCSGTPANTIGWKGVVPSCI